MKHGFMMKINMIKIFNVAIESCREFLLPRLGNRKWIVAYFIIIFITVNIIVFLYAIIPIWIIYSFILSMIYFAGHDICLFDSFVFHLKESYLRYLFMGSSGSSVLALLYSILSSLVEIDNCEEK